MNEPLDLEIKTKIYKIILTNPGLNLSTIANLLETSVALADYHLYQMEKDELIIIVKEGGYKRVYIKDSIGAEDKTILSLFQQEYPLKIVLYILNHPKSKPKIIREKIDISPALLTYYLKKLSKYGVIAANPNTKKEFSVTDKKRITNLLIQYRPNILLKRFKQTWADEFPFGPRKSKKK